MNFFQFMVTGRRPVTMNVLALQKGIAQWLEIDSENLTYYLLTVRVRACLNILPGHWVTIDYVLLHQ